MSSERPSCKGKNLILLLLLIVLPVILFAGYSRPEASAAVQSKTGLQASQSAPAAVICAYVNGKSLSIRPEKNSSAEAFIEALRKSDITVEMHDYGNFEKVGPLGRTLPRNDERITTEPGDVILYQGNQITIYYDVNSWSFTRLGKVQQLSQDELKEILGKGDVTVTFSLKQR